MDAIECRVAPRCYGGDFRWASWISHKLRALLPESVGKFVAFGSIWYNVHLLGAIFVTRGAWRFLSPLYDITNSYCNDTTSILKQLNDIDPHRIRVLFDWCVVR